jgi:hypothetical protein
MVALALWLVSAGVVACAAILGVYLAAIAVAGVVFGVVMLLAAPFDALSAHAFEEERRRRAAMTPSERQRAALARMFGEPPYTDPPAPLH